jgi:acetyl-CoA acetyltransferase
LVPRLAEVLLHEKGVQLDMLFQFENCTLPIDRITKFLKMLKMDLEHKKYCEHGEGLSAIEERYLKEISFAQNRINQRAIFTSNMETV